MGWVKGKLLELSLSGRDSLEVKTHEIGDHAFKLFGGGRGLAAYVYMRLVEGEPPDPLSPDNPLIMAPGLLVGSKLTTASKTIVAARSPKTGFFGRSSVGGKLGLELKKLGYDGLVISGALEEPGIIVLDCQGYRVESARDLWGLRVEEARAKLESLYPGYMDAIIGPAGENLSAMATIDFNGRQAGRTGMGAVMGSKKIKAIVAKGCHELDIHDPESARRISLELTRETHKHPSSKNLIQYGTPLMLDFTNKIHGVFPTLNWRNSTISWCSQPDKAHEELSRFAPKMRVGRNACVGCWRVCSQVVEVDGKKTDGPEYESLYALGPILGLCSIEEIAKLNYVSDDLGLDTISLGLTIAWAIEAGEKGIIKGAPSWGDYEGIVKLAHDIAYRRGLGELLADGVNHAVSKVGNGVEFAIHVKGLELPAYDARGLKGMAVGYAVSSRGGDHLTSGMYAVELPGKLWIFEGVDRLSYDGKGVMVKTMENLMAYFDNMGICKFSRYTLSPEKIAPLVNSLTGWSITPGDLLRMGERTVNIERILNLWMGLKPEDDWLPLRLLKDPIPDGPSKGEVVDEDKLRREILNYYAARGWNQQGIPFKSTLLELDILDLIPQWALKYTI
ncbi:MAG: aldehyde ferredoxin oxidoreductase family protein [Desulfurococcales archaeon]|nr:aldehyde ferredoxin oxidoreductase family protein [Desulfurococcales archaeon]